MGVLSIDGANPRHQRTDPSSVMYKRGRVFANLTPVLGPLSIVSIGLGTFLADVVGVARVLLFSGGMEFAAGVYGAIRKITAIPPPAGGTATGCTPPEKKSSAS